MKSVFQFVEPNTTIGYVSGGVKGVMHDKSGLYELMYEADRNQSFIYEKANVGRHGTHECRFSFVRDGFRDGSLGVVFRLDPAAPGPVVHALFDGVFSKFPHEWEEMTCDDGEGNPVSVDYQRSYFTDGWWAAHGVPRMVPWQAPSLGRLEGTYEGTTTDENGSSYSETTAIVVEAQPGERSPHNDERPRPVP